MLVTTAVFASILALMFIKLSLGVIALRRKNKVSLGAGGVDELDGQFVPMATLRNMCHWACSS